MLTINLLRPKGRIKWSLCCKSWYCSCTALDYNGDDLFLVCDKWSRWPLYDSIPEEYNKFGIAKREQRLKSEQFWDCRNFLNIKEYQETTKKIIDEGRRQFLKEAYPTEPDKWNLNALFY